jgi:hypothetical protein
MGGRHSTADATLKRSRCKPKQWMWKYQHDRHMALGGITPAQRLAMAA